MHSRQKSYVNFKRKWSKIDLPSNLFINRFTLKLFWFLLGKKMSDSVTGLVLFQDISETL